MSFCQRDCTFLLWRQVATCLLRSNIENRHNGNILKRHYCLSSFSKDRVKSLLLSDKHQKDKKQWLTCGRLFSTCMRNNVISNIYQKQIDKLLLPCFGGPHGCLELNRLKTFRRTLSTNTTDFSLRNPLMKNYLDSLIEEYEEIMEKVAQGDKSNKKRSSRMIQLRPVAELIQTLKTKYQEMEELTNLQAEPEMKALAEEELQACSAEIEQQELELFHVLTKDDKIDEMDIILEVTQGVGGQEAMLFALEIFNMYAGYAAYKGWEFTVLDRKEAECGGVLSASAAVSGHGVFRGMKFEGGVHRVQRVPKTEIKGRIHTSTITVAILPQPSEIDITINMDDVKVETFRASGRGGQHLNVTDSAVRFTHLPTGIVAKCQETRSQIKNRQLAFKILKSRLYEKEYEAQLSQQKTQRKLQVGNKARSEKVRTYNFPQDRITDHRLKNNYHNLLTFMTGGAGLETMSEELIGESKKENLQIAFEEFAASRDMKKNKVKR